MLEIRELSINYDGRDVLRDISLVLRGGEIMVLLGPNGAGKTTLIRAMNGAVPISGGQIFYDGRPISELSRREFSRRVAVVAQENETKFPVTVIEFVLSGRFAHGTAFGWETEGDIRHAQDALHQCGLSAFADRLMNELSGGERQRVVMARALAADTRVLLLDEPTANLDLAHQALMFRLVQDRCAGAGCSAVVITHDLNLAAEFADSVVMLGRGRIFARGTPEEVLTSEYIESVFGVRVLTDENPVSKKVRVTAVYKG